MATDITLVYPYFQPRNENSIFTFPPLGLGYIAAYLRKNNLAVNIVDCTFLTQTQALERIREGNPRIIGIHSMFTMREKSIELANLLRKDCEVLVAGGPLPTLTPNDFLRYFDVVVVGEGEQTTLELVKELQGSQDLARIEGIAYKKGPDGEVRLTPRRKLIDNLDKLPFPARESFEHQAYKNYYMKRFGYTITSLITSRGCPFRCDFCSRPIFGSRFRARSAANIVDEIATMLKLRYDRIWFADDCFTLDPKRVLKICEEIRNRGMDFDWECLSRVDTIDGEMAAGMKRSGCVRIFFGIESGSDRVLRLMGKHATVRQAKQAVFAAKNAGLKAGAFFILGYPGETNSSILDTVNFASKLPLDYLSFTFPYPVPGTPLYEKVRKGIIPDMMEELRSRRYHKNKLLFHSPFSEVKLRLAVLKGMTQFELRKYLGTRPYKVIGRPIEHLTDFILKSLH